MAISLRGTATQTYISSASQSWTLNYPSGVAEGDLLFAWFVTNTGANGAGTITGWTKVGEIDVGTDCTCALWWRIAGAAETSWTFTTIWDATELGMGVVLALQSDRAWPEAPILVASAFTDSGTVTSLAGPSINPNHANAFHIQFAGTDPGTGAYAGTPDASPVGVEDFDAKSTGASDAYTYIQHYQQGASAALALDVTSLTSDGYGYCQIAVTDEPILTAASGAFAETGTAATPLHAKILNADPAYRVVADGTAYLMAGTAATLTAGSANKTIAADPGSYAETGTAAGALYGRLVAADTTGYAETGTAATLAYGYRIAADSGNYTETGTAATLEHDSILSAETTAYAETGTAATLAYGYRLVADAGTYAETGTAADLEFGYVVGAGSGTYVETGTDSGLIYSGGAKTIVADSGSFALTGTAADLEYGFVLSSASGAFTETGTAADLEFGYAVIAESGAYTETGTDSGLIYSGGAKTIVADSGSFALTGTAATLAYGFVLSADSQAFAETGTAAAPLHAKVLNADPAYRVVADGTAYSATGTAATLTAAGSKTIAADSGSFAVSGQDASLEYGFVMPAASNAWSLSGIAASLLLGLTLSAEAGSFAVSGTDAGLIHSGSAKTIAADAGSYAVSGQDASLEFGYAISADAGSYAETGTDATLTAGAAKTIAADSGSFIETGSTAGLLVGYPLTIGAGAYTESGTDAAPLHHKVINANPAYRVVADGSGFAVVGTDAGLVIDNPNHVLSAGSGAYNLTGDASQSYVDRAVSAAVAAYTETGTAATPKLGLLIAAASGSYVETGSDAALSTGASRVLAAEAGSYAETGTDASLEHAYSLIADAGAFSETGTDAAPLLGRSISAATDSYAFTGTAAGVLYGQAIIADSGPYAVNGTAATLLQAYRLDASSGSFALVGQDATLTYLVGYGIAASSGSFAVTGQDATWVQTRILAADGGALAFAGTDAAPQLGRVVAADSGSYSLDGTAALFFQGRAVVTEAGSFAFSGTDADLRATRILASDEGVYVLTGVDAGLYLKAWSPVARIDASSFTTLLTPSTTNSTVLKAILEAPASVVLAAPLGGESWHQAGKFDITWAQSVIGNVKIERSTDGGSSWSSVIAASTPGVVGMNVYTSSHLDFLGMSTQNRIRVSLVDLPAVESISPADFTTTGVGLITVTYPNGGETWDIGTPQTITWTHNIGAGQTVRIELSRSSGATWATLISSVLPGDNALGSWIWSSVTGPGDADCRIRVTSTSSAGITDRTDVDFTIR